MIHIVSSILQSAIVNTIRDILNDLIALFFRNILYILIVIALVLLYLVLTKVVFRGSVYKTAAKDPMCVLTMAGRERSLEYLEKFEGMKGIEVQIIEYLRRKKQVPRKHLEKTFGASHVRKLIDEEMMKIV